MLDVLEKSSKTSNRVPSGVKRLRYLEARTGELHSGTWWRRRRLASTRRSSRSDPTRRTRGGRPGSTRATYPRSDRSSTASGSAVGGSNIQISRLAPRRCRGPRGFRPVKRAGRRTGQARAPAVLPFPDGRPTTSVRRFCLRSGARVPAIAGEVKTSVPVAEIAKFGRRRCRARSRSRCPEATRGRRGSGRVSGSKAMALRVWPGRVHQMSRGRVARGTASRQDDLWRSSVFKSSSAI